MSTIDDLAECIWNYHLLHHELSVSDCILCLCSNDVRVAEHAAQLYLDAWAPLLIFSGGVGALTEGMFEASEAEHFAQIAIEKGVPEASILVETRSTNTGENVQMTQALLEKHKLSPRSFIIVQKPFMERRAFATVRKHWPDTPIVISTPKIDFADYPNHVISKEALIHTMVGDLQRIKHYPAKGFQIAQDIPDTVWQAAETLIAHGYDQHLMAID